MNGSNGDDILHVPSTPSDPIQPASQFIPGQIFGQEMSSSAFSKDAWTDISARDSMSTLQYVLRTLNSKSRLAGIFHEQIDQEIAGNPHLLARPVGIVNFLTPCLFP